MSVELLMVPVGLVAAIVVAAVVFVLKSKTWMAKAAENGAAKANAELKGELTAQWHAFDKDQAVKHSELIGNISKVASENKALAARVLVMEASQKKVTDLEIAVARLQEQARAQRLLDVS